MKKNECQPDIKTKDDVLNQLYVSAYDMQILNPKMTYANALKYIKEKREEMKKKNLYVPEGQTKVALTKLIKKDCGF